MVYVIKTDRSRYRELIQDLVVHVESRDTDVARDRWLSFQNYTYNDFKAPIVHIIAAKPIVNSQ